MQKIIFKKPDENLIEIYGKILFRSPKGVVIFVDNHNQEFVIKPERMVSIEKIPKMKTLKKLQV